MSKADDLGLSSARGLRETPTTSAARGLQRAFSSLDLKLHASLRCSQDTRRDRPSVRISELGAPSPESCGAAILQQVAFWVKKNVPVQVHTSRSWLGWNSRSARPSLLISGTTGRRTTALAARSFSAKKDNTERDDTMAKPTMDLSAAVGKLLEEQDGDVLREGIRVLSQALMEPEVRG
jgi:hypothetical protein